MPPKAPISTEPVDLGNGYKAVPFEATTLNGLYLPQLTPETVRDWAVIGPDGKALQGETNRTYKYGSLEEARSDVATLLAITDKKADLPCPFCGEPPLVTKSPMVGAHPSHDLLRCPDGSCPAGAISVFRAKWQKRVNSPQSEAAKDNQST